MKKQLVLLAACFALALPAVTRASEPVRDRGAEAQDVASFFGLETQSYRVLTVAEADGLRGTGGYGHGGSLLGSLGVKANVNVKANVKVAGIVSVKANVSVGAKIRVH